jgi:hypothetical protein
MSEERYEIKKKTINRKSVIVAIELSTTFKTGIGKTINNRMINNKVKFVNK